MKHGRGSCENRGTSRREGQANQIVPRDAECSLLVWRNPDDTALPRKRCCNIQISGSIERHSLRTPKASEEDRAVAMWIYAVDSVIARCSRSTHVKALIGTESEMVSGNARFQRGEDECLALAIDFKDRPLRSPT